MLTTPVNTRDRPSPLINNNVLIQHPVTVHSSVIDIGHHFFQLILHVDVVVTVPTLEFDLLIYITLTFFSVLSPSHFILALLQSCVLSTVILINECEYCG